MEESQETGFRIDNYSEIYTLQQRRTWYSDAASAYIQVRPRYPQQIIDGVVKLARLSGDSSVLELGSGPGIATVALAKLGLSMVCLEPSLATCEIAQQNCLEYPKVKVVNTTFEEWELEAGKFDAVVAATSFHWMSAGVRHSKTAIALKPQGYLILLWNTPPQPSYEVHQQLVPVYQTLAPELAKYESIPSYLKNLNKFGQDAVDSGYFKNLVSDHLLCELIYSVDDYLALLSTLSPYIALEKSKRDSLFSALGKTLVQNYGTKIETSYLSAFHIVQKTE
ncbi:methyltransferase domain-containing protein [Calothrix sp. PCC 6303]